MRKEVVLGAAAAVLAALIWGGWFPISRLMVRDATLSPGDIGVLRYVVTGFLLLPVVMRHGLKAGRTGWTGSLVLTMTLGFPYVFVLAGGLQYAPAAHGALFGPGVFPAVTLLLGALILHDRVTGRHLAGIGLIALGVGAVGWSSITSASGAWQGYALFFLCAWMWAGYTICTRMAQIGALQNAAIVSVLSLVVFVPVYLMFGDVSLHRLPLPALLFQLAYHGLGNGLVALIAFNYAVTALGAAQAAAFGALVPCFATLLSGPIAGEVPGPPEIAGVVAVTWGIMLVNGVRLRRAAPATRRS